MSNFHVWYILSLKKLTDFQCSVQCSLTWWCCWNFDEKMALHVRVWSWSWSCLTVSLSANNNNCLDLDYNARWKNRQPQQYDDRCIIHAAHWGALETSLHSHSRDNGVTTPKNFCHHDHDCWEASCLLTIAPSTFFYLWPPELHGPLSNTNLLQGVRCSCSIQFPL